MNHSANTENEPLRPWYREPWPWVLIAIPLLTVIACMITLWLALTYPEHIVSDETSLRPAKAGLIPASQSSDTSADRRPAVIQPADTQTDAGTDP